MSKFTNGIDVIWFIRILSYRIACTCEEKFYDCLTEAANHEVTAKDVGKYYFNELDLNCIEARNTTQDVCIERRYIYSMML